MAIGNPEEVFSPRSTVVEILRKWSVYDINIIGFCMIPEDVHSVHDNGSTKNNGNLCLRFNGFLEINEIQLLITGNLHFSSHQRPLSLSKSAEPNLDQEDKFHCKGAGITLIIHNYMFGRSTTYDASHH